VSIARASLLATRGCGCAKRASRARPERTCWGQGRGNGRDRGRNQDRGWNQDRGYGQDLRVGRDLVWRCG
jgi:hypothetical protein